MLEKSRVTNRSNQERNFHVFYQFLKGAPVELKAKFGITGGVREYAYTKEGNAEIEGVNDGAEWETLTHAMNTLGLSEAEQEEYFRILSIILLLGNVQFHEDQEGQAQLVHVSQIAPVCGLLGVDEAEFAASLLNPMIKAGSEQVSQGRSLLQVTQSIEALSRSLYERLFNRLIDRINRSLSSKKQVNDGCFIGVLDMAGFEIFQKNSFEQFCINYTNEKLQQYFNHHMFINEQTEYEREKVEWSFVDFGLDLQPTIDLIEKANPIGVLACLDEDCVVPKATDKSFCHKLTSVWKGKTEKFETTRFSDSSFVLQHYAGKVEYNTDGWLEKNKDPLNENVTKLFARSNVPIVSELYLDYADESGKSGRWTRPSGKRGQFRTVAQKYRESLTLLMQTLQSTQPHFVRCIVPNGDKRAGVIEPSLVLDQLKCNGVLEGIRICRMGFPNRLAYTDFCRLYEILATETLEVDKRKATKDLVTDLGLSDDQFKFGLTKVFFKAGVISALDERKDHRLASVMKTFQAHCRGALLRRSKGKLVHQHEAKLLLQRNMKQHLALQKWAWWRLLCRVKPLLNVTRAENRIEELEDELDRLTREREQQSAQLRSELDAERNKLLLTETAKRDYERQLQHIELQLQEASDIKVVLMDRLQVAEADVIAMKRANEVELSRLSSDKEKMQGLFDEIQRNHQNELMALKRQVDRVVGELENVAVEKERLEKVEVNLRSRLAEVEALLEESRSSKKDLEAKIRTLEFDKQDLVQRLEDDQRTKEAQRQLQFEFEATIRTIKASHEEEVMVKQEEFDTIRKRMQREILQLTADLEEERKQVLAQNETIRKYESGNDSLTNKLETEMRNQETWKREKERLEAKIKDLLRLNQEATEREDKIQAAIFASNDQSRELRAKLIQLEDEVMLLERQKKTGEHRVERITEQIELSQSKLSESDHKRTDLDNKLTDAYQKLAEEQDEVMMLKEKLRTSEHVAKINGLKADEALRHYEDSQADNKRLEAQLKAIQLQHSENGEVEVGSLRLSQATIQTLHQLRTQLEAESEEKQTILRESRRLERSIHDLHAQLSDSDRDRIALEESLAKNEIRHRKLQTRIDQLEQSLTDLEFAKRKAERDLLDERDEKERIAREAERYKQRFTLQQQS